MHAVIVGAGIGGLTSALCLHRLGWRVQVLERAPEIVEIGAGLQISPNGLRVLRALGLEDAIRATASQPPVIEIRMGRSGRRIVSLPAGAGMEQRYGAPYLTVHRADLVAVLLDAVNARLPGALTIGADVVACDADAGSVALADGTRLDAPLIVGADGLRSTVRERLWGPGAPRFTGNMAWRAVVPQTELADAAVPDGVCVWAGPGRHAVTYPLRRGDLLNVVGIVETDTPPPESWTHNAPAAGAAADFAGWHPVVASAIAAAGTLNLWGLFDRAPIADPVRGKVVLLGDAWHPMLPSMAQGACMAIEDAWVLAEALAKAADHATALDRYARMRAARTARVQRTAAGNLTLFHKRSLTGQIATYGAAWLASRLAPGVLTRRTDWIFRHDVTADT